MDRAVLRQVERRWSVRERMKAGKAYITSLGTTGLLVASSVMLLIVVGALVAFDGWPTSEANSPPETVAVDGGDTERVVARRRIARERRAVDASSDRARPRSSGGAREAERPGPAESDDIGVVISPLPAPDTRPGGSGGGSRNAGAGGESPARDDPPADGDSAVVGGVGDTVSGVSPQAGGTIGQTGDAVGEAVEEVVPVAPSLVGGSQLLP